VPAALYEGVAVAYAMLGKRCGVEAPSVAVRSSAVDEDGGAASFAGQHETYLNVIGALPVADAVARCWASARSERALEYRRQQGLSGDGRPAVLVQQLVPADVAAVVFSANPVTGARDEVLINASWGLGESIVGGTVTPDAWTLRRGDLSVASRQIGEKRRMTVRAPDGTREVEVPRLMRAQPAIHEGQAAEMARLALALENEMGWPVDIECAWNAGQLYLLQCRPITTLKET
jgi:pyruvate,water dikinase